jgi:hypothetical protein
LENKKNRKKNIPKTIVFLIVLAILGACFVTSATAAPQITGLRGGYGVIATVTGAENLDWKVEVVGQHIFQGGITEGVIGSNGTATIRTPLFPPTFGFGKINITVVLYWSFIPVVWEQRNAFMVGPIILSVK